MAPAPCLARLQAAGLKAAVALSLERVYDAAHDGALMPPPDLLLPFPLELLVSRGRMARSIPTPLPSLRAPNLWLLRLRLRLVGR